VRSSRAAHEGNDHDAEADAASRERMHRYVMRAREMQVLRFHMCSLLEAVLCSLDGRLFGTAAGHSLVTLSGSVAAPL
jgi:hypothetical protein